jgi:peroxiredoxin
MDITLLVARVLLAAVFFLAAATKLVDRANARRAAVDFGVPTAVARPFALILPLAELAVAGALLPGASARWGALGALALLLVFVAAIALNLARGRKPDCRCFGQLSSSPVGWTTLVRNGVLAGVAAFIVSQGQDQADPSAVDLSGLSTVEVGLVIGGIALFALVAAQAFLLVNVVRQNGRLLLRLERVEENLAATGLAEGEAAAPAEEGPGLPVDSQAPGFQVSGLYGETLTLDALRAPGKPVMLVFGDPNCGPCNALLPEIGRWQRAHGAELTIALMTRGAPDENRAKVTEHGLINVLLQGDREVAEAYHEQGTPCAVIVRPDGTVGSPLAAGPDAIKALLARTVGIPGAAPSQPPPPAPLAAPQNGSENGAVAVPSTPAGPKIGDPAPPIRLPDLTGRTINLSGYRGTKTLVLFWNPGCGFCQQMVDDLRAWDAQPPEGAPKLLVVSAGSVEDNRAMGLRSPVLVDDSFTVGSAFGASGTPMGVLVDKEGNIASELVAGAPAVMALARGEQAPPQPENPQPTTPELAARVGDPAPDVRLPNIPGKTVDLADFKGRQTLVLFWNPGCGFCEQMLDDLRAWDANPPEDAPQLLVISTDPVEGLRSPVLLDPDFKVAGAFGANGTPMAVLVDEEGQIASEVAAGAEAVLALARAQDQKERARV